MSRGEGELLTVPKPRAVGLLSVCLTVKPVGEPDALIGHVRFDERGWETERCRMAQATAPLFDSTISDRAIQPQCRPMSALANIGQTRVRPNCPLCAAKNGHVVISFRSGVFRLRLIMVRIYLT